MLAVDSIDDQMIISAIVAKAQNNVIGKDNQLVWRLPADLQYFKKLTLNHCVLMGRKTFESIGRPLPQRTSIVLTRKGLQGIANTDNLLTVSSIEEGISAARNRQETEFFIIGGAEIYHLAMPYLHRLYVTEVQTTVEGDAFFPPIGVEWEEKSREKHFEDEKHQYSFDFVVYERALAY